MEQTLLIYTNLGFQLNQLIDAGEKIAIEITLEKLREKSIVEYLKQTFDSKIDLNIFTQTEYNEVEDTFNTYWFGIDENRKFGINSNGLCLLIAYCFQKINESI